ncbi:Uma2 family endonuclease [Streptacidiphilus jiangxiensis]|uniref:Putative restriction endonuclease n=1 Tax=Streptacidiphilus jiangxiensis TaxID=235985 RepID=A0A1H7MDB6_STRJI|nr:Uma2 family endonuclease [Streptacidiphilus jiangxiensis]SEL09320.1 Putative restriction endonuclease [Streptacidiphilus jiangxiensis]
MSIDADTYARLREIANQLPQIPGIGRVEIAHGEIVMMMSPVKRHELAVLKLARQLNDQLPDTHPGYIAHGGADLEDVGLGRLRRPDIMVFPEASLMDEDAAFHPSDVILVVEVVSKSNPENDYEEKVRDYAAMGIPLYLLVDPRVGTGIVHSGPKYASVERFAFGDTIKVGPWQLDTSVLLTYGP